MLLWMAMTEVLSTRIPHGLAKDLAKIQEVEKSDRATVLRRLLSRAVEEWKKEYALSQYSAGKVSLWRAARMAGITLREMMELAEKKGIHLQYTERDLEEDIAAALSGK